MLGCLEGEWVFVLDLLPLRSPAAPGGGLLSLRSDTFINLGLGVLNIVRFSLQRALNRNRKIKIQKQSVFFYRNCLHCCNRPLGIVVFNFFSYDNIIIYNNGTARTPCFYVERILYYSRCVISI